MYVVMIHQCHRQTDGRTDRQTSRRTDRWTDRRHTITRPHFALLCIAW